MTKYLFCDSVPTRHTSKYLERLYYFISFSLSHDVKYGSESGQQSVTGTPTQEDHNSNWLIKGTEKQHCKRGEPIACGQTIRMEHLPTKKNQHSHRFSSPLSDLQEISAFGDEGEGDTGDKWVIICDGESWGRQQTVLLRHSDTDVMSEKLSCSTEVD
ncbi:stromal cell-derived factor 2-like [Palaemon carinicauda]|uniref:stromal cell-derived factor 2-like n=1 Tax=Palaemon carinicauda TaxID=392227 RepID=UPI0035B6A49E